jgi:fructokinase
MVDTISAGDSFLATLIVRLLKGKSPQKSLNYACAIGALVAGQEGANPKIQTAVRMEFPKKNIFRRWKKFHFQLMTEFLFCTT